MSDNLQRICFDSDPACRVHHTLGYDNKSVWLTQFHYDTALIIDYFARGSGEIRIEGRVYRFCAGDMILLNTSELHMCSIDRGVLFERITLHVSEAILDNFSADRSAFFGAFYDRERGEGNLFEREKVEKYGLDTIIKDVLLYAKAQRASDRVLLRCKVLELLAKMNEAAGQSKPSDKSPNIANELIMDILQYVNVHYREDISLSDIAEVFYHSKYHVCHLFKEQMGVSLHDYIALHRIRFVNDLIRQGESVTDACYSAGFRNYSNFFRVYKKHMGITPQQFKTSL